jgi:hypothetical protein
LAPARQEGLGVVESVRRALSWLVVFAVGLAPMLVYWMAEVVGRAFRSTRADRGTGSLPTGNEREKPAERRDRARPG